MKRGRRVLTTVIAGLALVALGAGTVAATASTEAGTSGKKSKFKPKGYKGKWKGQWVNHTFNSRGSATMTLKTKGKGKKEVFSGKFDLGGNAFGCADPDPRKRKMTKGKGPNTWNSKGFNISYSNDFGPIELNYEHRTQRFSGSGTSPCTSDITYEFDGKMTKKKVKADTEIFLDGEDFATSTLKIKRKK